MNSYFWKNLPLYSKTVSPKNTTSVKLTETARGFGVKAVYYAVCKVNEAIGKC